MNFRWSEEEEKFRQEVRDFIKKELTPDILGGEGGGLWSTPEKRAFAKKLAQRGWVGISWPKEYGGQGRPSVYQYILTNELGHAGAPHTGTGVGTIGQTLMKVGSEELKREILPRIVRAELEFAIGYSEPQAGSDLAGLEVRADLQGDEYVVNGQKIWISAAHFADYIWLACRTNRNAPKHKGISLLLFPIKQPGITITPIMKSGDIRNNSVFFDNVRVPRSALVGQQDMGWYYLAEALDHERSQIFPFGPVQRNMERLLEVARSMPGDLRYQIHWKVLRNKVAELEIETSVQRLVSLRVLDEERRGKVDTVGSSLNKTFGTELQQRIHFLGMELTGLYGQLKKGSRYCLNDGNLAREYEGSGIGTVAGGSNEINRTVIAIRGLGLPKG